MGGSFPAWMEVRRLKPNEMEDDGDEVWVSPWSATVDAAGLAICPASLLHRPLDILILVAWSLFFETLKLLSLVFNLQSFDIFAFNLLASWLFVPLTCVALLWVLYLTNGRTKIFSKGLTTEDKFSRIAALVLSILSWSLRILESLVMMAWVSVVRQLGLGCHFL